MPKKEIMKYRMIIVGGMKIQYGDIKKSCLGLDKDNNVVASLPVVENDECLTRT